MPINPSPMADNMRKNTDNDLREPGFTGKNPLKPSLNLGVLISKSRVPSTAGKTVEKEMVASKKYFKVL